MTNHYSVLLFDTATFNPLFTVLGLLLGAVAIGLGYGAMKLFKRTDASPESTVRILGFFGGLALLGGAVLVLGLAALCTMWVAG